MQGGPLLSPCQPTLPRTQVSRSHAELYRRPSLCSLNTQKFKRTLPKYRVRHVAARAESGASSEGPLESIAAWWRSVTGQGPAPEKTVEKAREKAAERIKERASEAKGEAQQQSSSGKKAVGAAAETASSAPLKPYPKVADTEHAAPNNGVKRPATVSAGTQTDAVKAPKSNRGSESASWDPAGAAQAEWDEADQSSKPGLLGYSIVAGLLLVAVLTTSFLVKGFGRLRHSRLEKAQAAPAMVELKESRKLKKRAKAAEDTRLFADTKQEKRILKDKESIGDPAADAQGSQKITRAGDFKPWSKDELQTMKEAGDREAGKLEQETGAKPSAPSSKGRRKQQQQQMQEQQAQNIQDGHPRVWVPGQGWVAIDPDWDRQDNSSSTHHENPQASAQEHDKAGPSQERAQGYDADSETDGSELQGPASDKAESGSSQTADAELDEDQGQHRDEGRREGKPVQSAYALSQGVQVSEDLGHGNDEHDSAEGRQEGAETSERRDAEQTDQEHVSNTDKGRGDSERQSIGESYDRRQQDQAMSASGTTEGQQRQTTGAPPHSSTEHVEEELPRKLRNGNVREKDFEHEEDGPPLPLPSVGEIERSQTAIDTANLQLPSDLSVSSLRDRAAVAMRASLAAGEASHRAASYSSAASAAASKAAQAAQSAAQAASYAQKALDARSAEELEESVLRSARARAQAEELENRAATAAALATAHQEVSASQADVAEQAADSGAPAHQNFVQSAKRRSQTAWYSARSAGERIGHALMGWISTAWLWLQQAWHVVLGWGHRALYYLDIAWNWVVGFVTHAYARLKSTIRRH